MDIDKKVKEVLSILFQKEIASLDSFSMETEPLWDSIKHIEVIMTLEDELEVSFPPEQIPQLTSAAKLIAQIKECGL